MFQGDFQTDDKVGPYTLLRKLGEGQFGVMWLAEKRTSFTTTKFAVKLPIVKRLNIAAIEEEAKLWEKASGHRNVVQIIEAEEYDVLRSGKSIAPKQIVIVSEYVPDGSLETWLRNQGGRTSVETAIQIISEILSGLSYLHTKGIIHRDLKPANILLHGDTPRIADFGISRAQTTGSYRFTGPLGSLAFMAPETITAKPSQRRISKRTDLWSVGVMFYELLTGNLPFPHHDIPTCMEAIRKSPPLPLPSSIPKPIQDVVAHTLRKNPEKRYRSADEMFRALRDASSAPPTPIVPVVRGPSTFQKLGAAFKQLVAKSRRRMTARNFVRNLILSIIAVTLLSLGWNKYESLPQSYMESGIQKLADGDEDGAIEDLSYVISRQNDNAEAHLLIGNAFYNKQTAADYQRAIDSYNTFIKLRDADPRGYIARGLVYKIQCVCDLAIADFTTAINRKNDDPASFSYRAEVFASKGDLTNAIRDYDRVVELRKTDPETYVSRASLFQQRNGKGDSGNVISDLTRAIEVSQNKPAYYVLRAKTFRSLGDLDKAIKDYNEIIKLQKDSPDNYVARASLHFDKGDVESGMRDYDQALKLKNGDLDLYFERAVILFNNGKYDLAIADYDRYSNAGRVSAAAFYNRGLCYLSKENYEKAIEQFSQAISLYKASNDDERSKHLGDASFSLGLTYYDKRDYDKSIELFSDSIKNWSEYDATNKTVPTANEADASPPEPCSCTPLPKKSAPAERAKPASSIDADAYYYRGLALLEKGRKNEAVADLKKAIEVTDDDDTRQSARAKLKQLGSV